MARRKKTDDQAVPASTDLEAAQAEIEQYGSTEDLTKALSDATTDLVKAQDPDSDMDEGDKDEGNPETTDDKDADGKADEDEGESESSDADEDEEGDEDEDDESESEDDAPVKKSISETAGDALLKSVLTDADGNPSAIGEVIEVSDVLTALTDEMAKSATAHQTSIGEVLLQLTEVATLLKAQTKAVVALAQSNTSLHKSLQAGQRNTDRTPTMMGVVFDGKQGTPTKPKNPPEPLTKSQMSQVQAGIMNAYSAQTITQEQFSAASLTINSQGPEAALGKLPEAVAKQIRDAVAKS